MNQLLAVIRPSIGIVLLIATAAAPAWSQGSALTISRTHPERDLLRVDLTTGDVEPIGPIDVAEVDVLDSLAFLPSGQLIGADLSGAVVLIEPATGAATLLGDLGTTFYPYRLDLAADACGRVWMLVNGHDVESYLWRIDPSTGEGDLVGEPERVVSGLAAVGEELYGLNYGDFSGPPRIVRIDPETLALTEIATLTEWTPISILDLEVEPGVGLVGLGGPIVLPGFRIQSFDFDGNPTRTPLGPDVFGFGLAIAPAPGACSAGSPLSIPTASPWGLAGLAVLLAAAGGALLHRRRTA